MTGFVSPVLVGPSLRLVESIICAYMMHDSQKMVTDECNYLYSSYSITTHQRNNVTALTDWASHPLSLAGNVALLSSFSSPPPVVRSILFINITSAWLSAIPLVLVTTDLDLYSIHGKNIHHQIIWFW